MEHKHLLINATFSQTPFVYEAFAEHWLTELVDLIDMKLLSPPKAVRCDEQYNEGISAFCLITTSHISLHSWEKTNPNLIQLDVYSCKDFNPKVILKELKKFSPIDIHHKFLDRAILQ